jgi:hypothetical protein
MTKLLDKALQALEAARRLPAEEQDDIARAVLEVAGSEEQVTARTAEERKRAEQAAANIIARRKGVRLGGLTIKGLINEGRS